MQGVPRFHQTLQVVHGTKYVKDPYPRICVEYCKAGEAVPLQASSGLGGSRKIS